MTAVSQDSSDTSSANATGRCECGGIRFRVNGDMRSVVNCHCRQCLRTHGNFAAYTDAAVKDIEWVSDATLQWYHSSDIARRGFCTQCGSSAFWQRLGSERMSISAGLVDSPSGLESSANIFVASRGDYYDLDERLKCFDEGSF